MAINMADESAVRTIVEHHREAYGRLDVLVNNAGVGVGAPAAEHQTKHIDLQFQVNIRRRSPFEQAGETPLGG